MQFMQFKVFDSQLPESVRNRDLVFYLRRDSCTIVYSFGGMFGIVIIIIILFRKLIRKHT